MTSQPRLTVIPIHWKHAVAYNAAHHRHHPDVTGMKWATAVTDQTGTIRGVALCGRPISRVLDDGLTVEVNRTCTDGCPNANSALYGAVWRIAAAMGYRRIITYTEETEPGTSLRAAGYRRVRDLPARGSWHDASVALRHLRDPEGAGGIARTLWEAS